MTGRCPMQWAAAVQLLGRVPVMKRFFTDSPAGAVAGPVGVRVAWQEQVADLVALCASAFAKDEAQHLRAMRALLAAAPEPRLVKGLVAVEPARLERLIACDAFDSAALALIGAETGYLLSRGPLGEHLASVVLPEATEEVTRCGDTVALALVGAIAAALTGDGAPA